VSGEKLSSVPICPRKLSHWQSKDWTWISAVRSRRDFSKRLRNVHYWYPWFVSISYCGAQWVSKCRLALYRPHAAKPGPSPQETCLALSLWDHFIYLRRDNSVNLVATGWTCGNGKGLLSSPPRPDRFWGPHMKWGLIPHSERYRAMKLIALLYPYWGCGKE
jgi:hypothetical protein